MKQKQTKRLGEKTQNWGKKIILHIPPTQNLPVPGSKTCSIWETLTKSKTKQLARKTKTKNFFLFFQT